MSTFGRARARGVRALVVMLAIAVAASALLAFAPRAAAAFDRLEVDPGRYTGTNLYVPGETLVMTLYADTGDRYDVEVFHWVPFSTRTTYHTIDDVDILAGDARTLTWPIPATLEDGLWYWVGVYDENWFESGAGPTYDLYLFEVRMFDFEAWTDRPAYLPGDTVRVGWLARQIQDGGPALDGDGNLQVDDDLGAALIPPYDFVEAQGTYALTIDVGADPDVDARAYAWFNDTGGNHWGYAEAPFDVDYLGVEVGTDAAIYAPDSLVTVTVGARITDNPGAPFPWDPGAAGVRITITITDVDTGATTSYGASNLVTDSHGDVRHVFALAADESGVFEVQVLATAYGSLTAATSTTFQVESSPALSVSVDFDQRQYVSGEAIRATATPYRYPAGTYTYTYTWTVTDGDSGDVLAVSSGSAATFAHATPANFSGSVDFHVEVNDGVGETASRTARATVAFGYIAVVLDRTEYEAGQTITATYAFTGSPAIPSPSFVYEIRDADSNVVDAGTLTGSSLSFRVPDAPSPWYVFEIQAVQGGRVVSGFAQAGEAYGYVLSIAADKASYTSGETVRLHYAIRARGSATLPRQFLLQITLYGATSMIYSTTRAEGDVSVPIPSGSNEGDLVLAVFEGYTGAMAIETLHVGPSNALMAEVAGMPLFAWILGLLIALLFVLVLWRRGGPRILPRAAPPAGPPAAPPPPSGPTHAPPSSPMAVACRHCGKPIEITTSKRPIEVMCPACGETQLVA